MALYLNYELFHYCCHVKDDHIVRHIPLVNSIRRHHIAHHNTALMMERNFNLTYPIADWFFGTSDLACGLLRHVFNGYDTRFVRRDLKRVRNTSDDPRAAMCRWRRNDHRDKHGAQARSGSSGARRAWSGELPWRLRFSCCGPRSRMSLAADTIPTIIAGVLVAGGIATWIRLRRSLTT